MPQPAFVPRLVTPGIPPESPSLSDPRQACDFRFRSRSSNPILLGRCWAEGPTQSIISAGSVEAILEKGALDAVLRALQN